jgi:hypothetical protein
LQADGSEREGEYLGELATRSPWQEGGVALARRSSTVDVNKSGSPVQASGKLDLILLEQWLLWLHSLTRPPFYFRQPPITSLLLTPTVSNVRLSFLRLASSHRFHLDTRSSSLSNATTASTKTFLTALALNGIIAGVEIVAFTLVWRYFRLIYEPRSLSVFESCACAFVLHCPVLTSRIERDNSHSPLASSDGLYLSSRRIIVKSRISTDWTAIFMSVSSA